MLGKVSGLARALAILLSVVAGFVSIPGLDVALVIVLLSVVAGLGEKKEEALALMVLVLVLPAVGAALGHIPAIGTQLAAVAGNVALGAAAALGTYVAIMLFNTVKDDLSGLAAK